MNCILKNIKIIEDNGYLVVDEPSSKEKDEIRAKVKISLNFNQQDIQKKINGIFNEKYPDMPSIVRTWIETSLNQILDNLNQNEIESSIDNLVKVFWKNR